MDSYARKALRKQLQALASGLVTTSPLIGLYGCKSSLRRASEHDWLLKPHPLSDWTK